MGGPVSAAGVYHRRIVRLFHHAFDGEMLFLEPVTGSFAVYAHRYMSPFWLSYRPVILVYVDGGRDLGNYRHWGLRPVLVSGDGAVDTGADCRRTGCVGEFAAVRLYGEIEFWFAMIKVTTIIVMIIIGLG